MNNKPNPITQENGTCETKLQEALFNCCSRAYKTGINSVDIYKTLQHSSSQEVQQLISTATASKSSKICNKLTKSNKETKRHEEERLYKKLLNSPNSVLCSVLIFSFVILIPFTHFGICTLLNVNPLKIFSSIVEQRCLLSLHATILEMVRPIANCTTICQSQANLKTINDKLVISSSNSPHSPVIEFKRKPTQEEFLSLAYSSRPIIVRNSGSTNSEQFNFFKLKEIFESAHGGVESVSEECQFLPFRSTFTSLSDAFQRISSEENLNGLDPWYVGWSNCHPGVATKLRELFPRPEFLPPNSESSIIDWIFIGSPGLGAAMHIDYVRRPSWQLQLSGRKTWSLKVPPECETECPENISFTAEANDFVFLDTNLWYHETFIEGNELSISIGSEYD